MDTTENIITKKDHRIGTGKKKIEIKRKEKEQDRLVAFSKRRKGLFKKAHQLNSLSSAQVAILVFSPAGKPYVYGVPCFNDIVHKFYYDHHDDGANEDFQEIDECMSWLGKMDFEACDDLKDLVSVKNDLEIIREKLVKRIAQTGDCNF